MSVYSSPSSRRTRSPGGRTRSRGARLTGTRIRDLIGAIAALEEARGAGALDLGDGAQLDVSNLDKPFFPKRGFTKGDLMAYYASVSPLLLPAVADRPLVMKRFPNGVGGESFYQQRAPEDPPADVRVEPVADEGLKTQRRLIGGDLATLLYVVQLGAISIDPWHSRVQSVGSADYAIVDLDPGPRSSFRRVVDVALWVGEELDRLGLHGMPKTSGASGIHIVLPLIAGTPNETARLVAELVATRVAEQHPRETTVTRWVQSRPSASVYVDFLQNIRGKTVASVYSARATPDATVSAPLRWSELTPALDPRAFTIESMAGRLREVGDLWRDGMRRLNDPRRLLGDA
jgi:bifunctional non-homologous end joining protein LigD